MNIILDLKVVNESGYEQAMIGLSFNKKQSKDIQPVAEKLFNKDGGHNKFLESIYVWLEVTAPRYWWQEADTYRIGTKQSESTMHTLINELKQDASNIEKFQKYFEPIVSYKTIENFIDIWNTYSKNLDVNEQLILMKSNLPEGFLQRRMWCLNYKTLRNIIQQRKSHRLPH